MTLEKKFLLIALIAVVLALPVTYALKHRSNQLHLQKSQNSNLQIQLDVKQKESELKTKQILEEQKKNADLSHQLQTKRDTEASLAKAKEQALQAPVSFIGTSGNCESYRPLVAQYDWNVSVAMAVMQAESGCRVVTPDNSALNYDGVPDHGLFQLHGIPVTDPAENIRIAYQQKYLSQGWGAWSAYKSGAYLRYL